MTKVGLDVECLSLVRAEIERRGSIKAVAQAIGYARPSLSLAMRGAYEGNLGAMSAAIRSAFDRGVLCPHLVRQIGSAECRSFRERALPAADPRALRHWQACAFCTFNPDRRHP